MASLGFAMVFTQYRRPSSRNKSKEESHVYHETLPLKGPFGWITGTESEVKAVE